MSEEPLSDAALEEMFTRLETEIGRSPHCCCTKGDHGHPSGQCPTRAALVVKLHMCGNCRRARLARPDLIDEEGNGTQVICRYCYDVMKLYVRSTIRLTQTALEAIALQTGTPVRTPMCECGIELVDPDRIAWIVEELPDADS